MYICICNGVTDSQVRQCVRRGAGTLSELQMELGIACQCGTCASAAINILREEGATSRFPCVPALGISPS